MSVGYKQNYKYLGNKAQLQTQPEHAISLAVVSKRHSFVGQDNGWM